MTPFAVRTIYGTTYLSGELDLVAVPQLLAELARHRGRSKVALDLVNVTFLDSAGIHAVLDAVRDGCTQVTALSPRADAPSTSSVHRS